MEDGVGPTLNPKTKPVDIFSLSKAEALGGVDYHTSGFKHSSVRVFGLKGRGLEGHKYGNHRHGVTRRHLINV